MRYTEVATSLVMCGECSCAIPAQAMTSHSAWHEEVVWVDEE